MSKLMPVRRMDKNGVMTTKWVTPPSGGSTGTSSIPAPKLPSHSAPKIFSPKYNMEIDLDVTEVNMLYNKSMLKYSMPLVDFDIQTIQAVEYMVNQALATERSYQADREVGVAFNIAHSRIEQGASAGEEYTAFNNLAVFGDAVMHPDTENNEVQALVAGIYRFTGTKDFLLEGTDDEREKAIALVTAAARLNEPFLAIDGGYYDDHRTISIKSDILAQFIMSRPDDAADIARIVNDRGTDDIDTVREVLDHGNKVLSEGVL